MARLATAVRAVPNGAPPLPELGAFGSDRKNSPGAGPAPQESRRVGSERMFCGRDVCSGQKRGRLVGKTKRGKGTKIMGIADGVADILVQEGFNTLEEVAYVPLEEMLDIESFDEATVNELRSRARNALLTAAIASEEKVEHGIEDLLKLDGMDEQTARTLAAKGVTTQEQLADLDVDELVEMTGMDGERANTLIMAARAPWFA